MTTTIESKYNIEIISKIKDDIDIDTFISEDIIKYINELTSMVGAPTYSKTPVFSSNQKRARKKKKTQEVSDDDWEAIRQFQTTDMTRKSEGIESDIDDLRVMLNKLTGDNLVFVTDEIMSKLEKIMKENKKEDEYILIGNTIFEIASSNKFYSDVYADLYEKIMNQYEIFKTIFTKNYEDFTGVFEHFDYVSAEEDYDKFCEYNKKNEKRKALSSFFINLMKLNIVNQDSIVKIIKNLQKNLEEELTKEDNREICEELTETLYILITEGSDILDEHDEWEEIHETIKRVSEYSSDDKPSASNKLVFKHLDILDELI